MLLLVDFLLEGGGEELFCFVSNLFSFFLCLCGGIRKEERNLGYVPLATGGGVGVVSSVTRGCGCSHSEV